MTISTSSSDAVSVHSYRPDIDGLRAIAILLVVFFHAGFSATSGGFVGVDVFFVISGYLITGIITRELDNGRFSFSKFYTRRIMRICPALFVVLAFSVVAAFFTLVPEDLKFFGRSLISAVLFYSNWLFYQQVNYFSGPAIDKALLHTWSLAIEEQYYVIWPLALFGLYRVGKRKALPQIILALICLSLAASQVVLEPDRAQVFYLLPYRAWELLLGGYLAVAPWRPVSQLAANVAGLAGFAAIAYAAAAFDIETPFPGLHALFPCLGAAMLIAAGSQRGSLSKTVLSFGPFRFIGKISYSVYLIHWPIFSFAHSVLDRELTVPERFAVIGSTLLLAALSYRYIEIPARHATFRFPALLRATAAAAAALALTGGLYEGTKGLPWRVPQGVQLAYAARFSGFREQDLAECRNDPTPALVHRPCPIGAAAKNFQYDFVIWGDSHARHFASAFSDQAKARGLSGLVIWETHCPPLVNEDRVSSKCRDANAKARDWIASQSKLKMVFLGANWNTYAARGLLPPHRTRGIVFENAHAGSGTADGRGLEETIALLRSKGFRVALVDTVPYFPVDVPNCVARARMFGRSETRCLSFPRTLIDKNAQQASSIIRETGRRFNVPIVDTMWAFCDGDTCSPEMDGAIFYSDSSHLNSAGSHYLGTRLNIPWPSAAAPAGATALR